MLSPHQELIQRLGVTVSSKDYRRLSPHISNWPKLNELFILGVPTEDLKKMLVIEISGKKRKEIVTRLCARIKSQELRQLRNLANLCLR